MAKKLLFWSIALFLIAEFSRQLWYVYAYKIGDEDFVCSFKSPYGQDEIGMYSFIWGETDRVRPLRLKFKEDVVFEGYGCEFNNVKWVDRSSVKISLKRLFPESDYKVINNPQVHVIVVVKE